MLPRLAGGVGGAVQHRDAGLRHIHQPGLIEQRRDAGQVAQRALARGQVIDRQHGVRLAAAEGGLQLDDRLAALAVEPLRHLGEQQAHALGDEGALEKCRGVLVFRGRLAGAHGGDVGGKLGLLERAFQHVGMGNDDFSPRFHGSCSSSSSHSKSAALRSVGFGALLAADSMPVQLVMSSL